MGFVNLIETALEKFGFVRTKGFEKLWAMAQESRLFQNSLSKEYAQVPTVYKAIKAIADNVCQVELKFFKRDSEEEVVNNADLKRLFKYSSNPLMSFSELLEATAIFHRIHGEAFWIFEKSVGQAIGTRNIPAQIWTFNPQNFSEVVSRETGQLTGWKYKNTFYDVTQVMHFRDFNPYDDIRGLSPLSPARNTIDIDWQSLLYNKAFFQNDATPSFVLSSDSALTDKQRERLKEFWNKEYRGASKAFKMAVLESGLKPVTISQSGKDMQFIEQRQLLREELIGIWRVPKSMFSITDDLNYATFVGQKKVFWTDTLVPLLSRLSEEINSQFFSRFMPDVYCKFDFSNVDALKEELTQRLDSAVKLWQMGVPFNVINDRLELGLDPIEGGDIGYLPFSVVPASMAGEKVGSVDGISDEEDEEKKSIEHIEQRRTLDSVSKAFINLHTPQEVKMMKKVRRFMFEQRIRLLSSINEKSFEGLKNKSILFPLDWQDETDMFQKMMRPLIWESIMRGVEFIKQLTPSSADEAVLVGKLKSYLGLNVVKLSGVTDTMRRKIEKIIGDSIKNGETIVEMSNSIRSYYNSYTPFAALRIARTETTKGLNGGTYQYLDVIGAKTKTWVTAGDELVRQSHIRQNGMTIMKDARFPNGLLFPSDEGNPEESINCRCTLITQDTL